MKNNSVEQEKNFSSERVSSPLNALESPRCPKCKFVMCEQFDAQQINGHAELVTPNGTYICYGCNLILNVPEHDGETGQQ